MISSSFRCIPIICSNGNVSVRTTESDEMDTLVSEQLASEIELMHNWGEKTRSGDNAIFGFKVDDTSGIA